MDPVSTETRTDGRIDRRLRNREAVLEATIKMFIEGEVIPAMDDVAERIEYFCGQRLALYFRFAPLARVALVLDEADPLVRDLFDYGRDTLSEQFAAQFETELGLLGHQDWAMATTAATLPLQYHLFEYMHVGCGFDATEMHALVVEQLQLHLSAL
jgi:hypothetical protein